ncbi:MAG: hypothetical protein CVT88_06325 [Candidatus Altiarchaeales archaeon HGW-Altiarchaeales-1]|nr:MAG: hypothetical protein CVT88_06325 [Candidatus Altiarchaeales archaeon HGW-Altiarchaeales-1]
MNLKLKILIISIGIVISILISGCVEEKPEEKIKITIMTQCKDNTTKILMYDGENYDKILNESMKIVNSASKKIQLLVPEEIKNETISESCVELTFSKTINISTREVENFSAKKIIIVLSGKYKDMIFIYDGKYWNTQGSDVSTDRLLSLTKCYL